MFDLSHIYFQYSTNILSNCIRSAYTDKISINVLGICELYAAVCLGKQKCVLYAIKYGSY